MLQDIPSPTAISLSVDELLSQSFDSRVTDIRASIDLAEQALIIANKDNNQEGQANAKSHLAYFLMIIGNHVESRKYADAAAVLFKKHNNYAGLGMVQYTIGSTY